MLGNTPSCLQMIPGPNHDGPARTRTKKIRDFCPMYFLFENYDHVPKGDFSPKKLILVHFRRENTVDRNRILGATPTRDLNSFKHFSGPKNKTSRISKKGSDRKGISSSSGVNGLDWTLKDKENIEKDLHIEKKHVPNPMSIRPIDHLNEDYCFPVTNIAPSETVKDWLKSEHNRKSTTGNSSSKDRFKVYMETIWYKMEKWKHKKIAKTRRGSSK